jgi:hypothetical protein
MAKISIQVLIICELVWSYDGMDRIPNLFRTSVETSFNKVDS